MRRWPRRFAHAGRHHDGLQPPAAPLSRVRTLSSRCPSQRLLLQHPLRFGPTKVHRGIDHPSLSPSCGLSSRRNHQSLLSEEEPTTTHRSSSDLHFVCQNTTYHRSSVRSTWLCHTQRRRYTGMFAHGAVGTSAQSIPIVQVHKGGKHSTLDVGIDGSLAIH